MGSTYWAWFATVIVITYLVYVPIGLYCVKRFRDYGLSIITIKKHYKLVIIFLISAFIWIALDRPLHQLYYTCLHFNHFTCCKYTNISLKVTYPTAYLGILFSPLIRIWLVYYDIKFNQSTKKSKWKILINPALSKHQNWFIKNKIKYGNKYYLLTRIFIPSACCLFIIITAQWSIAFINPSYVYIAYMTDLSIILFVCIMTILITCKTPKLHDAFNISTDTKRLVIIMQFLVFGSLTIYQISAIFIEKYYAASITGHYFSLGALAGIISETHFVFTNLKSGASRNASENELVMYHHRNVDRNPTKIDLSLEDMFRNKDYFEFFIEHVMNEFSIECMLSFIEFQQYQQLILAIDNDEIKQEINGKMKFDSNMLQFYGLNKSIPDSFIVHQQYNDSIILKKAIDSNVDINKTNEYIKHSLIIKNILHKLYSKYIERRSEFEINIKWEWRSNFESQMKNFNEWMLCDKSILELLMYFQDVKLEMVMLLQFSFGRFCETDVYKTIAQLHAT